MNTQKKEVVEVGEKYFIDLNKAEYLLRSELEDNYNHELFLEIIKKFLVVKIIEREKEFLWLKDLNVCKRLLLLNKEISAEFGNVSLKGSFLTKRIKLSQTTELIYSYSDSNKAVPAFVRNILYITETDQSEKCAEIEFELLGINVITTSRRVRDYVENAVYRKHLLDHIKYSSFAKSSSYMGTKRKLTGFIVEAMIPHTKEESIFLDIMCGSGAVSNALAQMGQVYASDAQAFCMLLAKVQGRGYDTKRAERVIKEIYKHYTDNLSALEKKFSEALYIEDEIFHMDLREKKNVYNRYKGFLEEYKLYSTTEDSPQDIVNEINRKKENRFEFPYCLFSYYFANVFFGLSQCIQLDSIRYAIDQIQDKEDKEWALGVLIIVTSVIATTYGGHFAQPKRIDELSFESILVQRGKSAWLEFSKRMLTIAAESERYSFPVNVIKGPWQNALATFGDEEKSRLVVYLDAPYKREEYSRYYHVLETMAIYDYPDAENKGRMRSKKNGERFKSEFFSKTTEKIEKVFEKIIGAILDNADVCVWSYSNNGAIGLINVVTRIKEKYNCNIYFYSIPHEHFVHGGKRKERNARMEVIEYCVVFAKE